MIINKPDTAHLPALRTLWQQAFGDPDDFPDSFFATAYSPERCRVLTLEGKPAAALYWFDCSWEGKRLAYLYAVATDAAFRRKGLCRALMAHTHQHLAESGYAGAVLVPGSEALFRLYEKLGYRTFGYVREFACNGGVPVPLRSVDAAEYARLRRSMLPAGGILQEGALLAFLRRFARFYAGENLLLAATVESGKLTAHELLGDCTAAPGIVAALGADTGYFRTPGNQKPFAMYLPLTEDARQPGYLGLALD